MLIEQNYEINYDLNVSQRGSKRIFKTISKDFNQERFDKLVKDCQKNIITSIVTPFGLGRFVAVYDKLGGNVTTIHNANQGICLMTVININEVIIQHLKIVMD